MTEETKDIAQTIEQAEVELRTLPSLSVVTDVTGNYLSDQASFAHMQRIAKLFASSPTMVPEHYRNVGDCFIAIQLAKEIGINPITFMQKSYPVKGRIGIEGQLAIALINLSGVYKTGVRFTYEGQGETRKCIAYGVRTDDGSREEAECSVVMAKQAGWYGKNPNWSTLTDQMLAYRSGIFLGRRYHPNVLFGLHLVEEVKGDPIVVEKAKNLEDKINALESCKVD